MFGSVTTALTVFHEKMNNIMKIVKSLEDSGLLIKGVSETIKSEAKEQNGGFLDMLLGISSANLIGNMSSGKE